MVAIVLGEVRYSDEEFKLQMQDSTEATYLDREDSSVI